MVIFDVTKMFTESGCSTASRLANVLRIASFTFNLVDSRFFQRFRFIFRISKKITELAFIGYSRIESNGYKVIFSKVRYKVILNCSSLVCGVSVVNCRSFGFLICFPWILSTTFSSNPLILDIVLIFRNSSNLFS
jgi:hypothetical protein